MSFASRLSKSQISASSMKRVLNWYPPWLGAGIRLVEIRDDFSYAKVSLPLTWYNRNAANVHFGGSLFAMCDPVYMLLLLRKLGSNYIVWDKAASIDFVKPGKTTVTAEFNITDDLMQDLQAMQPDTKKYIDLQVNVNDTDGDVVTKVKKTLYIRRKPVVSKL